MEAASFDELERGCFEMGQRFARELLRHCLEMCEDEIRISRNTWSDDDYYKNVGGNEATVKTLMGEVTYWHRYYQHEDRKTGSVRNLHLLDEVLGINLIGRHSLNLSLECARLVCEESYREAAVSLSALTGIAFTPQGLWGVVNELGAQLRAGMGTATAQPKRKVEILFEEADGVYIKMRGSDRPATGHAVEMKVAAFYEGSKTVGRDKKGKPVYECVNKRHVTGFEPPEQFFLRKEQYLAQQYDLGAIDVRLINGDGADWIKTFASYPGGDCHVQLDPYHRNKAIREAGIDGDDRTELGLLFAAKDIPGVFASIDRLLSACGNDDEVRREKLERLRGYYRANESSLIPIMDRGLDLPAPTDGIEYRGLGTMESSIGNLVARRMKGRKASFSKRGALHLSTLIGLKLCGELEDRVSSMMDTSTAPFQTAASMFEGFLTVLTPKEIGTIVGKGWDYPSKGGMPFESAASTVASKVIRDYVKHSGMPSGL
jgi:hypothetical protein